MASKTQSVLNAPQPIITVKEAKKLLGVASKNIPDADIERFTVMLEEIASTYIQEKVSNKAETSTLTD